MKIALFTETYLPYINGVVTHVKALKDGLETYGHTVMIVTADADTKKHFIKDGVLHCPGTAFEKLYNYGLASPISIKRLSILKDFDPDIIHIHNEFGVGLSGTLIARFLKIPLVYTLHTMYDDYLYYIVPRRVIPALKKVSHYYTKFLAKKANEVTGPSQKVQEFFDLCGAKKSVSVVPNPVELDKFNPQSINKEISMKIRCDNNVLKDDMLVCFCGRLGREKSVDVLLSYWANRVTKDDNIKLMILGDGPCLEELRKQAESLNIADMVFFTGVVEHDSLLDYYGASDLYITTSLSDTNSISMKEAMATGLPVLHIVDPLNHGQIIDGVNGYTFHDDEQMYRLLKDYQRKTDEEKWKLKLSVFNSVKIYGCEALASYLISVYKSAIIKKSKEPLSRTKMARRYIVKNKWNIK